MKRRDFVAALGAVAAAGERRGLVASRINRVGLQTYSVREAMSADPEETLVRVHAMGYADVELLWTADNFGRTPAQVRNALHRAHLTAPSAHIAPESLLADWSRSLDTAKYLGHQYLIVPSLPAETSSSLEQWHRWAEHFNRAGEAARKADVWLAFHNEPEHQHAIDGQVPYDLFIAATDPSLVRLQLDVGNMLLGGGDPLTYLQAHRERYWSFHLKDVTPDRKHDTELGSGIFDLRSFLRKIPQLDQKPCYVEQEAAADPMASAARNARYLRALRF
jgi:sugar phosphate isomerase/epimerase